jgi:hypothetical protein
MIYGRNHILDLRRRPLHFIEKWIDNQWDLIDEINTYEDAYDEDQNPTPGFKRLLDELQWGTYDDLYIQDTLGDAAKYYYVPDNAKEGHWEI